jgi:hypothetical protein
MHLILFALPGFGFANGLMEDHIVVIMPSKHIHDLDIESLLHKEDIGPLSKLLV